MVKETGYALIRFSKKTGKVDTAMNAMGSAMLDIWGLQNTTKTKTSLVIDLEDGSVLTQYTGDASGFPTVTKNPTEWGKLNGELLEALRADYNARIEADKKSYIK